MSGERNRKKPEKGGANVLEKVVVAVKASKDIPRTALVWALTHVVEPGDCISLLVVVPSQSSGNGSPFSSSLMLNSFFMMDLSVFLGLCPHVLFTFV